MRFHLLDRIVDLQPGRSLRGLKNLTLGEEYLADHFPAFPVMPGVLMLQTLVESAAWLLRVTDDFGYSIVTLREARGVKYGNFMEPGRQMEIAVDLTEQGEKTASFRGKGEVEGNSVVAARLTLCKYNLRERDPELQTIDEGISLHHRELYKLLRSGRADQA
jgi:3-hydroxyacyl-[acyl-carrier-protein] dehydratase